MKYGLLFLTLISLSACTDSGGGGKSSQSLFNSSNGNTDIDAPSEDAPLENESPKIVAINSLDNDSSEEEKEMEEIINNLDEDSLSMINSVMNSLEEEEKFVSIKKVDTHYNLQKFNTYNFNDNPVTFLINYHSQGSKLYKFHIASGLVEEFQSSSSLRIRSIFHYYGDDYFLTQKPIKLFKADKETQELELVKDLSEDETNRTKSISLLGSNLCVNTTKAKYIHYNLITSSTRISDLDVKANRIYCNETTAVMIYKEDNIAKIKRITSSEQKILAQKEVDNKISLFQRSDSLYYSISLLKNEERPRTLHQNFDAFSSEEVSSLSPKHKRFDHLKTYINTYDTNKDNAQFKFIVYDRKLKENVLEKSIESAIERENLFQRLFKADGELFLTTRSQRTLFKYEDEEFSKLGNPHGLNLQSVFMHNGQLHLAQGKLIFSYDSSQDWTVGRQDYMFVKREHDSHNPKLVSKLSHGVHKAFSYEDELYFIKHKPKKMGSLLLNSNEDILHSTADKTQLRTISGSTLYTTSVHKENIDPAIIFDIEQKMKIQVDGHNRISNMVKSNSNSYFAISRNVLWEVSEGGEMNKLLTFAGRHSHHMINTPNDKLLLLNNSNIILFNPKTLDTQTIYQLDMSEMRNISSMVLHENKLFMIDRFHKLHQLSIPVYKLSLFDQES